jgi:hypothetical protein
MTGTEGGRIPPALGERQPRSKAPCIMRPTRCVPQTQLHLLLVHIDIVHIVLEHRRFASRLVG